MRRILISMVVLTLHTVVLGQYPDSIRLNDVRFLTSHNSYKRKPDPKVVKFLQRFKKKLSGEMDPIQIDYGHELLSVQMNDYAIRGFELDVNYDPKGGHFKKRRVNFFIGGLKQRSKDSLLREPGFKILHIADVDYESNYTTFKQAITEVRDWSLSHPNHTPVFINIEIKRSNPGDYSKALRILGFKKAVRMDSTALHALDQEIMDVFFNTNGLYSPAKLKGSYPTVQDRLSVLGWPSLNETCGKVFFILDGDVQGAYLRSLDKGDDRPMFLYGKPDAPSTAFVIENDPIGRELEISNLSEKYMVRTRSDAGTLEARSNDRSRWESALKSNAQIISTDYYRPDPALSSFYVQFDPKMVDMVTGLVLRTH
jgi:hypothetical protein